MSKKIVEQPTKIKLSELKDGIYTSQVIFTVMLMFLLAGGVIFLILGINSFGMLEPYANSTLEAESLSMYNTIYSVGVVSTILGCVLPIFSLIGIIGIWSKKEEKLVKVEEKFRKDNMR